MNPNDINLKADLSPKEYHALSSAYHLYQELAKMPQEGSNFYKHFFFDSAFLWLLQTIDKLPDQKGALEADYAAQHLNTLGIWADGSVSTVREHRERLAEEGLHNVHAGTLGAIGQNLGVLLFPHDGEKQNAFGAICGIVGEATIAAGEVATHTHELHEHLHQKGILHLPQDDLPGAGPPSDESVSDESHHTDEQKESPNESLASELGGPDSGATPADAGTYPAATLTPALSGDGSFPDQSTN